MPSYTDLLNKLEEGIGNNIIRIFAKLDTHLGLIEKDSKDEPEPKGSKDLMGSLIGTFSGLGISATINSYTQKNQESTEKFINLIKKHFEQIHDEDISYFKTMINDLAPEGFADKIKKKIALFDAMEASDKKDLISKLKNSAKISVMYINVMRENVDEDYFEEIDLDEEMKRWGLASDEE